jgi:hypothetical protein
VRAFLAVSELLRSKWTPLGTSTLATDKRM